MGAQQMVGQKQAFDTKDWKDLDFLTSADHKVAKVKVLYETIIIGIQVFYRVAPYNLTEIGQMHMGTNVGQNLKIKEFIFQNDEFIIEIYGRAGAAIDQIGFKTGKRDLGKVGAESGEAFSLKADKEHFFSTFSGGCGGFLDYLNVSQSRIPYDIKKFIRVRKPNQEYILECLRRASRDDELYKERKAFLMNFNVNEKRKKKNKKALAKKASSEIKPEPQESAPNLDGFVFLALFLAEQNLGQNYIFPSEIRSNQNEIQRDEFLRRVSKIFPNVLQDQEMQEIFDDLDEQDKGYISQDEFDEFLRSVNLNAERLR